MISDIERVTCKYALSQFLVCSLLLDLRSAFGGSAHARNLLYLPGGEEPDKIGRCLSQKESLQRGPVHFCWSWHSLFAGLVITT